jgi:hypothetical protein
MAERAPIFVLMRNRFLYKTTGISRQDVVKHQTDRIEKKKSPLPKPLPRTEFPIGNTLEKTRT